MRELPLAYSYRVFRVLLFLLPAYLSSQTLTVLDEKDEVLTGVEVYSADYIYGEVTDQYGQVSLDGLTQEDIVTVRYLCLLYTSPSPRDQRGSRMPSSA